MVYTSYIAINVDILLVVLFLTSEKAARKKKAVSFLVWHLTLLLIN